MTAWNNLGLRIAGGVIVAGVLSIVWTSSSYAVSGTGYFSTSSTYTADPISISKNDVLSGSVYDPSIPGRDPDAFAIPSYIANNAGNDREQLYDWLRGKAASDGVMPAGRDQVGVSFIVHTMLGDAPGGTKRLYASDWTELYNRLVLNPDLEIYSVNADPNGYGNGLISFSNDAGTDDFFASYNSGARPLVIIRNTSNNTRYVLERYCANPVGGLSLPEYTPFWGVNGYSSANVPSAAPGDTITWTHRLRNNMSGTNVSTSPVLRYETRKSYSSNLSPYDHDTSDGTVRLSVNGTFTLSGSGLSYKVQDDDVGTDVCQYVRFAYRSSTDHTWHNSTEACVTIPYDQNLVPKISVPSDSALPDGTVSGISATVENAGDTVSEPSTTASVVRFVMKPKLPTSAWEDNKLTKDKVLLSDNNSFRCDVARDIALKTTTYGIDSDADTCVAIATYRTSEGALSSGSITGIVDSAAGEDVDSLALISGLEFGDRVCYVAMVNRYAPNKTNYDWSYSDADCVAILKTPTVHVLGNDVRTGSAVDLSDNTLDAIISSKVFQSNSTPANSYGSWSEYGVIAPNTINGFASGSGLNGVAATVSEADRNRLTFANTIGGVSAYGSFVAAASNLGVLPAITSSTFTGMYDYNPSHTGTVNLNSWTSGKKTILVYTTGDVTIGKDITIPNNVSSYDNVWDMPQMVIIAKNIRIKSKVKQVDAWLIASGTISTCGIDEVAGVDTTVDIPNINQCGKDPLTINGPVVAKNLLLYRTYGADTSSNANLAKSAETINFSAGSYIWAKNQSILSGGIRTVSINELPPRY